MLSVGLFIHQTDFDWLICRSAKIEYSYRNTSYVTQFSEPYVEIHLSHNAISRVPKSIPELRPSSYHAFSWISKRHTGASLLVVEGIAPHFMLNQTTNSTLSTLHQAIQSSSTLRY